MAIQIEFVVLHYNVEKETKKAIEWIKKNVDTDKYHIVVVDNHSPDGSGKKLKEYYKGDSKVKVILLKDNLGYAKGNNKGIYWARKHNDPQYICVMNNDVHLLEKKLYEKIEKEYANSRFAVLGPYIRTPKGKANTNPVNDQCLSKRDVYLYIMEYYVRILMCRLQVSDEKVRKKFAELRTPKNVMNSKTKQYNIELHGCFLIFSREYFKVFHGFDSRTFMFGEEEILYRHVKENNLVTVYTPEIEILHKEDAATNSIYKQSKDKRIFQLKNSIRSFKVLLKVIESYR